MDIENSHHDFEADIGPFDIDSADPRMAPVTMTPICLSQPPTLNLDYSTSVYSTGRSSTASSFFSGASTSGCNSSTACSASTAASECSSRRESVAQFEESHYLAPAVSPSPANRQRSLADYDQSLALSYPATQLSYQGPTVVMPLDSQRYEYRENQINIGHDDILRTDLFMDSHTDLPEPCMGLQDFNSQTTEPAFTLRDPTYTSFDETRSSLDNAPNQYISDEHTDDIPMIPSLAPPFEEDTSSHSSYVPWPSPPLTANNDFGLSVRENMDHRRSYYNRIKSRTQRKEQKRLQTLGETRIPVGIVARQENKLHKCAHCPERFVRQEHRDRHKLIHPEEEAKQKLYFCPMRKIGCNTTIRNRRDNMKAHIIKTHFTPSEKKPTMKINIRVTMKKMYEDHKQGLQQGAWAEHFDKGGNVATPADVWEQIRGIDLRFPRLLDNLMTIHDMQKHKGGDPTKPTRFWTMIGWSILEAQSIRIRDIAPEMEYPDDATLSQVDPRMKALNEGSLSIEDAEYLGVDMLTSQEMGLRECDPRWKHFDAGQMSIEDAERHAVRHLMPAKKRRYGARL